MSRRSNLSAGYTLIEMTMTLVIVAILSVAVYSRFFSTVSYNQQVYYSEVLNSLRYARKLAIATGSHIQFSVTSTSITLQQRTEGSSCTVGTTFQPVVDPATRASSYVKTAPGTITLSFSSDWPLYFDGLGAAHRTSDCTVISSDTITISGGNTVTVVGQTGFVQ